MNKGIYYAVVVLLLGLQVTFQSNHVLEISGKDKNAEILVWMYDQIEIVAESSEIKKWFFNEDLIAELDIDSLVYNHSTTSPINVIANISGIDSILLLNNITRIYTGNYKATGDTGTHSLNITVHEVDLSSIEINVTNTTDSCKAYLHITDYIEPSDFEVNRKVNLPELTFLSDTSPNDTSFEIANSILVMTENSIDTLINVQYCLVNNFCTDRNYTAILNPLINKPMITVRTFSNNCTVSIKHNINVECVRAITYCLDENNADIGSNTTNNTNSYCNTTDSFDTIIIEYLSNFTSNLSIVYDIIYVKYEFTFNILECSDYVMTSVEPTTMNSLSSESSEITTTESDANNTTPAVDTTTTKTSVTTSGTPINETTTPPKKPESYNPWKIAFIVVASVFGVFLIGAGIAFGCWKKKHMQTFDNTTVMSTKVKPEEPGIPLEVLPAITQTRPMNRTELSSPSPRERTEREQRRHNRRHLESPNVEKTIRPTIPDAPSRTNDLSSQEETRRNRRTASPNYERSQQSSTSADPTHHEQASRGRRRPLPPISND